MHIFTTIKVNFITLIMGMAGALVIGYAIGYFLRKMFTEYQVKEAEERGKKIVLEADKEVENRLKSAEIEAREKSLVVKAEFEKEMKDRQENVRNLENNLERKERDFRTEGQKFQAKEKELAEKNTKVAEKEVGIEQQKSHYKSLVEEELKKLEVIGSYTADKAREEVKNKILDEAKMDAAREVKKIEADIKKRADDQARQLITMAVQRLASDHVAESTVSVVELPSDDIKGRIIGREGRNIRALEQATGIDLIIDDTPGAVVLSGFDPIRREVARRALEQLTLDGRIHPGRIEDVVGKCKKEVTRQIEEAGEQAVINVGIDNINPEIVKLLGRLKYRTSYTQNVLEHVQEVAFVCGAIAGELGLNVALAKRAGLLHDIGKAIDHQTDGTHTQLGVDIAKRYNEHPFVVNSIAAHHEDCEAESPYAVLVAAGDTISASRPGARREMLETYIKRMSKLEEIGDSFKGVQKTFAIQAGREVRIIVMPNGTDDQHASILARDVAKRIEKEVIYPGEIKVTVVRETRFTEFAR
ncbi:MAG: ribonuclease Y [Nitrospina sp.]|jgi:ribonucrease Y|nr:ribonuclease Y [Nitrospina sp.]MBT3511234.1 ribonuclease Y [Nitrospina sp.]MBT3876430.1 ribonuclease Y [Nitrospina sp.]MBT4047542.1 ribonuclease Y [Nitrospina sp.]MBT4558101.1 ribonuclease Y [Nitrospina sp.]